jgi:flagellin
MNTQRWLGVADMGMKKSLERLSSGYRINKAADDAAGLAISQAFRANIASFKVASRNTSEAAALLQVAEGGMDQIGNMLTRLKELATQSASANVGSSERAKIDSESTALLNEIDRIANSSKYGSTALLDGTFGAAQTGALGAGGAGDGVIDDANDNIIYDFTWTAGTASTGTSTIDVTALGSGVEEGTYTIGQSTADVITIANSAGTVSESYSGSLTGTSLAFANLGITITITDTTIGGAFSAGGAATTVKFERTGLTSLNVESANTGTYDIAQTAAGVIKITNSDATASQIITFESASTTLDFNVLGISFNLGTDFSNTTTELNSTQLTVSANTDSSGNTFQIGAENNSDNQIQITVAGTRKADLGIGDLALDTAANAQIALDLVDTAIGSLAGSRGEIGAAMNRLSYASANLATTIENQQAAESVIRDVDMAAEMTTFTKNQILLQAGTAMLAQANMAPQQVLALFG